ncbi:hypothetical protein [Thiorhodovibrio frisius]|uniref:Uncharacterized protein n=1 Tax=Thiorhodovibrio frisius TaxID=631362 RepID=H8YYH9_9GAMM|nr:hypothetical protein [Thiorhodovibrio frisius]EIC23505.1 hypothetical protein Thi970DRAFT_01176 [Thiorhodovibrio frisius]WPL23408.1 hypothetical protein Thiofri_03593 [Thiorhodovibrio frisius]
MAELEQIEMSRYRDELAHDLRHLVKKYCRIMAWEVPELDEKRANQLIIDAMRGALKNIDQNS